MATIKNRIKALKRLWNDLMADYQDIVFPYGMGYNMPEEKSNKATEIMNHAEAVRKKYEKMEEQIGVVRVDRRIRGANKVNIDRIKNKSLAWAIDQVSELIAMPKIAIRTEMNLNALEFLSKLERDKKLELIIADDKRYIAWFENRYRTALLYCYQALKTLKYKGCPIQFYSNFIKGFINQEMYIKQYQVFKDKNFGDGIGQDVL